MGSAEHILIVDDDSRILDLLKKFLEKNGYLVSTANSALETTKLSDKFNYDLIILDVMMPDVTGIEFADTIKSKNDKVPIIMLTALSEVEDKIKGLEAGANDYLTKPFEPKELLLRIKNLINMNQEVIKHNDRILHFHDCSYNVSTCHFSHKSPDTSLSSSEEKLLKLLISGNNQPISREQIAKHLGDVGERSVDVQIKRLRDKIESNPKNPQFLKTVRHQGYVLYVF